MPVTWCYHGEPGQQFCSTGFPMGCYVQPNGKAKDACVVNVSSCFYWKIEDNLHHLKFVYSLSTASNQTLAFYSIISIFQSLTTVVNWNHGELSWVTILDVSSVSFFFSFLFYWTSYNYLHSLQRSLLRCALWASHLMQTRLLWSFRRSWRNPWQFHILIPSSFL